MLSPGERANIKAEIERLQKAQTHCTDGGIREKIDAWIEQQKQKLAARKPCRPGECVTDVQGRPLHKKCYRASRISPQY
jgi:hypothetical protein